MAVTEALGVAVVGFGTVFLMLALLWFIIAMITRLLNKIIPAQKEAPVVVEESDEKVAYGGEIKLFNVDEKSAACIMAIVSESSGIPLNQLIFKEIRALDD